MRKFSYVENTQTIERDRENNNNLSNTLQTMQSNPKESQYDPIIALKNTLIKSYENNIEIKNMFGKALKLEGQYINLQMLYYLDLKEVKDEEAKKELEAKKYKESRPPSFEDLFGDKRSIKPEDLFKPDKALFSEKLLKDAKKADVIPNFLLIQGRAGIGKTTFVRYVTREWACGRLYQEYEWVFTLVLRKLRKNKFKSFLEKGKSLKLWEWIYHSQFSSQSLDESEFRLLWQQQIEPLMNQGKVLLIIDGYDELPENYPCKETMRPLLKREYAHIPKIVTTRPYGISKLSEERRDLEIIGFTDKNIKQYINQYFESKPELGFQLLSFLEKNPTLWATCHIPLHLNLICWMLEKETSTQSLLIELNQLNTMTGLYTAINEKLWERCYISRSDAKLLPGSKSRRSKFLEKQYSKQRQFLSELAFKGMNDEKILLSKEIIDELLDKYEVSNEILFMKELRDSGVIKPVIEEAIPDHEQSCEFLHLTFQEYYAAIYIVSLLQDEKTRISIEEHILAFKFNPHWQIVWWFVAGLLKFKEEGFSRYLKLLQDSITRDLLGNYELGLLGRIADESYGLATEPLLKPILERLQQALVDWYNLYRKNSNYLENLPPLIRMLQLCPNLLQMKGEKNIAISLLQVEPSGNMVSEVLNFLGTLRITTPYILNYLNEKLLDDNKVIRKYAVSTVEEIGVAAATSEILKSLSMLLADKEWDVRKSAISAVVSLGSLAATPEFLKSLSMLLADKEWDVRESAVSAVVSLGSLAATPEFLKSLSMLLTDKEWYVRSSAISAVVSLGSLAATPEILKSLSMLLADKEWYVRKSAISAVVSLGSLAATPEFLKSLSMLLVDKEWYVRSSAVEAVVSLGSLAATPEFLNSLGNALINENWHIEISSLLSMLSKQNFVKLFQAWCSLYQVEGLTKSIPCLIAITLGSYLAGNIQVQIFCKEDNYQFLIYVGASAFKEAITLQQARTLINLMPSIVDMFEKQGQINIKELMGVTEQLPKDLFEKPKFSMVKFDRQPVLSTPTSEGGPIMYSLSQGKDLSQEKALVEFQCGKVILMEDLTLQGVLQHSIQHSLQPFNLGWIDKQSQEQVILRKVADHSPLENIQEALQSFHQYKHHSDRYGNLLSHWASMTGRKDLVPLLKQNAISFTKPNKFGLLPLHMAVVFNQTATLGCLIETFGRAHDKIIAPYKALNGEVHKIQLSPFHLAILLGREEVVSWYLNKYKDIEMSVQGFGNILHLAVCGGQTAILNLLLEHSKTANILSGRLQDFHVIEKLPVLSYAAAQNHAWTVYELMLAYQRHPEWKEMQHFDQDQNALIEAVRYGAIDSVQMLLEMNVKVDFSFDFNSKNITIMHFAQKCCKQNPSSITRGEIFTHIENARSGQLENRYKIGEVKNRKVKNIVFQGGGIKGLAHVGAYQAFCYALAKQSFAKQPDNNNSNYSSVENIDCVAGTSAGSIFAMALALGFSTSQLSDLMKEAPFAQFLDDIKPNVLAKQGFWNKLFGLFEDMASLGGKIITFASHPLLYSQELLQAEGLSKGEVIMAWLSKIMAQHLIEIGKQEQEGSLVHKIIQGIHHLEDSSQINLDEVIQKGLLEKQLLKLTFGQLRQLVGADKKRFKHLFTVALRLHNQNSNTSTTEGIEVMHSQEGEWEQVLIIDAIRASMSIPVVFIPHQVRQCNEHGMISDHSPYQYVDGGLLKNYPIELFDKFKYLPGFSYGDGEKPEPNPFTIGFRLFTPEKKQEEIKGWILQAKEKLNKIITTIQHTVEKETAIGFLESLANLYYLAEDVIAEFQNVRAGRTIHISNEGVSTLKFELTPGEKEELILSGEMAVCKAYEINYEEYKKYKEQEARRQARSPEPITYALDNQRRRNREPSSENKSVLEEELENLTLGGRQAKK